MNRRKHQQPAAGAQDVDAPSTRRQNGRAARSGEAPNQHLGRQHRAREAPQQHHRKAAIMGSLGRRRILRARGSTSALIEAAAAAGGEGEDRFASAFGRLDAARRRHKRAARLDAGRAAWMQQHAALAQAARRFDDDEKAMVPRDDLSQIDELRTMVACLAQADDDQAEARRRAAAIVARMMVDARQAHASKGAVLAEEEAAARLAVEDAVATMGRALARMMGATTNWWSASASATTRRSSRRSPRSCVRRGRRGATTIARSGGASTINCGTPSRPSTTGRTRWIAEGPGTTRPTRSSRRKRRRRSMH